MSELKLHIEKVAGVAAEGKATQVFSKKIEFLDGGLGTIVACVLASGEKEKDFSALIKDFFEITTKKLEESYSEQGILNSLEEASLASSDYLRRQEIDLSFVYLFFFESVSYIVRFGEKVKVWVFEPPKSMEVTFEKGSGPARGGQTYLTGTEKFFSSFDISAFKQEAEIEMGEMIDGVATEISSMEDQSEVGAVFVIVKDEEVPKTEEGGEIQINEEDLQLERAKVEEIFEEWLEEERSEGRKFVLASGFGKILQIVLGLVLRFFNFLGRQLRLLKRGDLRAILALRRNLLIVALLILSILAISGGLTVREKIMKQKEAKTLEQIGAANAKYNEGLGLIELNRGRARELFVEADKEVKVALQTDAKNQAAKTLSEQIASKLKETESLGKVDFSTFFEGGDSLYAISMAGKNLVAFSQKKIYKVSLSTKKADDFEVSDGGGGSSVYGDSAFFRGQKDVFKLDFSSGKVQKLFAVENGQDMGVFIGNVYVLSGDQILKFVPVADGYASSTNYLEKPQKFSNSSRMAIDGSLWVTSGKDIYKYLRGHQEGFSISGLPGNSSDFGIIYTSANLPNLYVIDRANSALLVISKEGNFQKALQAPEFSRTTGILVSDDGNDLYISSGNKVLQAKLK